MEIYKIVNNITGKIYIGQTVSNRTQRICAHLRKSRYDSPVGYDMRQQGISNFTITTIDYANTKQELDKKEAHWIRILNCLHPKGYNKNRGIRRSL